MKIYGLVFLLLSLMSALHANEPLIKKKKVPIEIALPLLQSIDRHAVIVGSGPIQMYAFIDPVCPRSRDFVEMIYDNKKMQSLYTYHLFFYELKRFHTHSLIADIYKADDPLVEMVKIMINKEKVKDLKVIPENIEQEIDDIAKVAEQLDIYKRPYLFVVKPKKGAK